MNRSRIVDAQRLCRLCHQTLRPSLVAFAVLIALSNSPQRKGHAQDDLSGEPFSVFVAHEKAFARCGPSDEYYRTDPLRHGQQLEVYLETDDGWLGVRPPASSFCWIPASAVQLDQGSDNATVIEDRSVCWIGTHLGRARQYRWQVQLAEGEQVTILGRSERDGPDGPQTWYRIVPPSGEFRWVHRDHIAESAEALIASVQAKRVEAAEREAVATVDRPRRPAQSQPKSADEGLGASILQTANALKQRLTSSSRRPERLANGSLQPLAGDQTPQLREAPQPGATIAQAAVGSGLRDDLKTGESSNVAQADNQQAQINQASMTQATQPRAIPDASVAASTEFLGSPKLLDIGSTSAAPAPQDKLSAGDGNWVSGLTRPAIDRSIQKTTYNEPIGPSPSRVVSADKLAAIETEVRAADIGQLQLILSRLMAAGASATEVKLVTTRAHELAIGSRDQVAAGRARLLAERSEQYQRVALRRDGSTVIRENGIPVIPASGSLNRSTGASSPAGLPSSAKDAGQQMESGYLVQVYSARTNSPPFALTDHAGNTIAYVTPSPGINLRMHLNSHVKVAGTRGFLQGLNTPHIVVSQAARVPE